LDQHKRRVRGNDPHTKARQAGWSVQAKKKKEKRSLGKNRRKGGRQTESTTKGPSNVEKKRPRPVVVQPDFISGKGQRGGTVQAKKKIKNGKNQLLDRKHEGGGKAKNAGGTDMWVRYWQAQSTERGLQSL